MRGQICPPAMDKSVNLLSLLWPDQRKLVYSAFFGNSKEQILWIDMDFMRSCMTFETWERNKGRNYIICFSPAFWSICWKGWVHKVVKMICAEKMHIFHCTPHKFKYQITVLADVLITAWKHVYGYSAIYSFYNESWKRYCNGKNL